MRCSYYSDIFNRETFCYGDVLIKRRCVTGDVQLRRLFGAEMFCMETFCRGDVLCGEVLYVLCAQNPLQKVNLVFKSIF
jgi:hypothetical protein